MAQDWIDNFVDATDGSPKLFRKWTAITILSGMLGRKVWTDANGRRIYPNLYTILVGPPAIGKSIALKSAEKTWRSYVDVNLLIHTTLLEALKYMIKHNNTILLLHDLETLAKNREECYSILATIYDTPDKVSFLRSNTIHADTTIIDPSLTVLAATQLQTIHDTFPQYLWDMGMMGRFLFICATAREDNVNREYSKRRISNVDFIQPTRMTWSAEAQININSWHKHLPPTVIMPPKLQSYYSRKTIHGIKLSMISAISREEGMEVTNSDVDRARSWLAEMEEELHHIL